ncbi:sensor histidine kinase [Nonomuraea sp. NPDC050556]|uniref:sensor histidine kinase n=1 Tax=Nonomuraea sp. NPDC050556 TaxID=3364369 RepID=UPI0037909B7D
MTADAEGDRAERGAVLLLLVVLGLAYLRDMTGQIDAYESWGPLAFVDLLLVRPVLLALQVVHSLPRFADFRSRHRFTTLTAQAVLTFLPPLFLGAFIGNLSGFLAGSCLLLLRAPWSWIGYGLAVAGTWAVSFHSGVSGLPLAYYVIFSAVAGLWVFGISRLTDVIVGLHRLRRTLVELAVARERLTVISELHGRTAARLAELADSSEAAAALAASHLGRARPAALAIIADTRIALTDARELAGRYRRAPALDPPPMDGPRDVEPRFARMIILSLLVLTILYDMSWILVNRPGPAPVATALVGAVAFFALQLRHSLPVRPRGWVWTLCLQGVLTYASFLVDDLGWIGMAAFFCASLLLLVPPPWSWALFAAATASIAVVLVALGQTALISVLYYPQSVAGFGLAMYGTARFASTAVELRAARTQVARMAQVGERLRLSRDMHDVVGSSLSAMVIKSQLAVELLDDDRAGAERELREVADLARRAAREVTTLSDADSRASLAEELDSARAILTSTGIETDIGPAVPLPPALDHALAMVVREAVTNVLRHSKAQYCRIETVASSGLVWLTVSNDGVAAPRGEGTGLGNLAERLQAVGGRLDVSTRNESFLLTAMVHTAG